MVKSSTNTNAVTAVAIFEVLILIGLPCSNAQSPMGAPPMSPGSPTMSAPAPSVDCATALANVSDCLSFVLAGSNMTVPDKACCPEFAGLLDSNPICLCQLVGNAESFGVDINRALMLPGACKLKVPPLDSCPAAPGSAPSPSSMSRSPGSTAVPVSAPSPRSMSRSPGSTAVPVSAPSPRSMSRSPGSTAGSTSDSGQTASPESGNGGGSSNGALSTTIRDLSTIICLGVAIFIAYYL